MVKTIEAIYDGHVFHPSHPLDLEADTQVLFTFEPVEKDEHISQNQTVSFFEAVKSIEIDGPPDWSVNLDHYLYGVDKRE